MFVLVLAVHHPLCCGGDNRPANRSDRCADRPACQSDHAAGHRAGRDSTGGGYMRFPVADGPTLGVGGAVHMPIELCIIVSVHKPNAGMQSACRGHVVCMPEAPMTLETGGTLPVRALHEIPGQLGPFFSNAARRDRVRPPMSQVQGVGRRG